MKKRNFDPSNYYKLNNLREKIIREINKHFSLNGKKILEIGTGSGSFSKILAKNYSNSYIESIDTVSTYIDNVNNNYKNLSIHIKEAFNVSSTYDAVFMVYSLTELLKNEKLENILKMLNNLLLTNGILIIADEFTDDYSADIDLLGLEIMKKLGYRYLTYAYFEKEVLKSNFEIFSTIVYDNKQNSVNIHGAKLQIFYENMLNEYDNSLKYNSDEIWNSFKNKIKDIGGIRTYNKTRLIILRKKDNIIEKFNSIKHTPCLYYSLNRIENNIKYFNDLNIDNLYFAFPVKTFPNTKILDLFYKYNFCYDVSNENEKKIVDKYNTLLFYSDPTNKLKKDNSIRINIEGLNSHFGLSYDGNSYSIYHLHLSINKDVKILNKIIETISALDFTETEYLDIGGSYDNLNYLQLYMFLKKIRNIVPDNVKIVLEMGSMWFNNTGYLISSVEFLSKVNGVNFAFINASRDLHAKWSVPLCLNMKSGTNDYVICGPTCYENDLFEHIYNSNVAIGDKLIFKNIEPYSYSFNSSFNGIEKARVIIDE